MSLRRAIEASLIYYTTLMTAVVGVGCLVQGAPPLAWLLWVGMVGITASAYRGHRRAVRH